MIKLLALLAVSLTVMLGFCVVKDLSEPTIVQEFSPMVYPVGERVPPHEIKEMTLTCYSLTQNLMASNLPVGFGAIAVDPKYYNVLRINESTGEIIQHGDIFATKIEDVRFYFIAMDIGGHLVRGENRGDVWWPSKLDCINFGTPTQDVEIFKAQ